MARLNLDNLSGLLAMETVLSPPAAPGAAAVQHAFDEHLLRAQFTAAPLLPEDYRRGDGDRAPGREPRSTGPDPAIPARDDTGPDSAASDLGGDSDSTGTRGGTAAHGPESSEMRDDPSRGPGPAEANRGKPNDSEDDESSPSTTCAAESGAAAAGQPTPRADDGGNDHASEKAEHADQAHGAARKAKSGKKAENERASGETTGQSEPTGEATASGRDAKQTEAAANGSSAEGSGLAEDAIAATDDAKQSGKDGAKDVAAGLAPQTPEVQVALQTPGSTAGANGPDGGEIAPAEASATQAIDHLTATHAAGPASRRAASRAAAKARDDSRGVAAEPDAQSDAAKADGPQEVKPANSAPASSDLASAPTLRSRADAVESKTAESPLRGGDSATTKPAEEAPRPAAADHGQRAPGSEQADRVRFVQRVARAFEAAADRGGTVRLRLHPPELGSLRLELTVRNGKMNARVEAETDAARTMIVENLSALRQRLAEHQIRVERFDVNWSGHAPGDLPQQSQNRAQAQPGHTGQPPFSGTRSPDTAAPAGPSTRPAPGYGNHFDVVI